MPAITSAEILRAEPAREAHRVVFLFHLDDGGIHGPFVEHRPPGEDHQAWCDERIPDQESMLNPPNYYEILQNALNSNVAPGTYDAVRRALRDTGTESVELGPAGQLNVTYPELTNPEDIESELRERVDAEIGAGTLDGVKAVLGAMGIETVTLQRKSELTI
jgi:hypothetical protein